MLKAGSFHTLEVVKHVDFGIYLMFNDEEILMPKRFVPDGIEAGDTIDAFIYHDNDGRLIATTQEPFGEVGDIVLLEVADKTRAGAFLKWGIMKDLFLPLSQQRSVIRVGGKYLVYIYVDEKTGRVAASEYISRYLDNENLTVKEGEEVDLTVWRKTDIGFAVVINGAHEGLVHHNELFKELNIGEQLQGFIKSIQADNKINVSLGKKGYARVEDETDKVLRLLQESNGYLPYNDKSNPDDIYEYFQMSKRAFKMAVGALYKQRKITFTKTGIKATDD